jgi:hypothetical protein
LSQNLMMIGIPERNERHCGLSRGRLMLFLVLQPRKSKNERAPPQSSSKQHHRSRRRLALDTISRGERS